MKLSDSESEAAETQVWLQFAYKCGYIEKEVFMDLYSLYDRIIGKIINMINTSQKWCK